ncbi:hypothetical protein FHR72_003643 [Mycolicibacterium iranicum]|uniref:Helix-turn-helix domain-containing protein n=1 Tax=Mycolicibacterium iranicum TaxID=912594 RepID=A0A839Q928_MYCIR|nr:hypothetical protein [Mycolicibacterium iranicum]
MALPIIAWDQAYNRNGDGKLPRAVMNVIRTYMNNHTLAGWVSQETLARDIGLDESNVRRQIKKNTEAGWIAVTKRGRAGRASEYRLTYPQPGANARLNVGDEQSPTVQIRTVTGRGSNQAQMPGYTPQPGADARLLPGADARPTTRGTSPQEKFPIAVGGRTEAPSNGADTRGRGGPTHEAACDEAAEVEHRPVGLQPPTATGSRFDDPFAREPAWLAGSRAREERGSPSLQPAAAGGPPDSPWD